jgi:hypothetical protein
MNIAEGRVNHVGRTRSFKRGLCNERECETYSLVPRHGLSPLQDVLKALARLTLYAVVSVRVRPEALRPTVIAEGLSASLGPLLRTSQDGKKELRKCHI